MTYPDPAKVRISLPKTSLIHPHDTFLEILNGIGNISSRSEIK
jgi:hypothetical protein